jgi:hypothetical protein
MFRTLSKGCLLVTLSVASFAQLPLEAHFVGQTYNTGPAPTGIVSGDFNRDGLPDLAVTDQEAGNVKILLGVGDGKFALGAEYSTGLIPTQIVTADFNHDGKLDLAVALSEADAIAIFLGNGDGTFHQGTSIALDGNPFALVAADFNRDGIPDLAVIEHSSAPSPADTFALKILRAKGNGTFIRSQAIPLPRKPVFPGLLVSDDFNVDGLPDLAVATDKTVMVFTDSTNGTLHLHSVLFPPNTASIVGLAAGRLTQRAAPDLVVRAFDLAKRGQPLFPNSEYVFLNSGLGSFQPPSNLGFGDFFGGSVYLADVNGDGLADLVSVGMTLSNMGFGVALGHGDGTFLGESVEVLDAIPVAIGNSGFLSRDLNLDSRHDFAIAGKAEIGTGTGTQVLLNQNAQSNCRPPGSSRLAARICSPTPNAAVRSSFTVRASGNSPAGVKRIELWADGVKRAQSINDQLRATIHLSPGTHRLTVVGVDLYDNLVKKPIVVHVP